MDITVVTIALLIGLLFSTLGIYFKSEERSTKRLVSGKLVAIILVLMFILAIITTDKLVLLWLAVLFFTFGILIYFFGMAEMVAGYEFSYTTIAHEQREKLSKSVGLLFISFGILSLAIASIDYIFKVSEGAIALLMAGGIFFGIAKLRNARFGMLFGVFCAMVGILMPIIPVKGVFIELAIVFLCMAGVFILLIELAMKQS